MIRHASDSDVGAIVGIYNHYVRESVATFEESEISESEMRERVEKVRDYGLPWLVSESDGIVTGYAYATKWNSRSAYKRTVEISVYLEPQHTGRGIGSELYADLFEILEEMKFHAIIGGITLPNPASERLHEKFGLRKVAHFKEVGFKFCRWLDVGYWQRTFEA